MTSVMSLIMFNGIDDINPNLQKMNHSLGKDLIFFPKFLKIRILYFLKADIDIVIFYQKIMLVEV